MVSKNGIIINVPNVVKFDVRQRQDIYQNFTDTDIANLLALIV